MKCFIASPGCGYIELQTAVVIPVCGVKTTSVTQLATAGRDRARFAAGILQRVHSGPLSGSPGVATHFDFRAGRQLDRVGQPVAARPFRTRRPELEQRHLAADGAPSPSLSSNRRPDRAAAGARALVRPAATCALNVRVDAAFIAVGPSTNGSIDLPESGSSVKYRPIALWSTSPRPARPATASCSAICTCRFAPGRILNAAPPAPPPHRRQAPTRRAPARCRR